MVRKAVSGRCAQRDEFLHELSKLVELTDGFNLADLYLLCKEALLGMPMRL